MRNYKPCSWLLTCIVCLLLLAGCSTGTTVSIADPGGKTGGAASSQPAELLVFAAASLADALTELKPVYEKEHPGIRLTFNFASSGTLEQQIRQGAGADLFLSAGKTQMDELTQAGLIDKNRQSLLLSNRLVIIVPADKPSGIAGLADTAAAQVRSLAIGDPATVPAGLYARQALEKSGVWDAVKAKTIFAKDVRQVLAYVETGNADAGIVYATDARISAKVKVAAVLAAGLHDPIAYPAGVTADSRHPEAAADFYAYLRGNEAMRVFAKYGFSAPGSAP